MASAVPESGEWEDVEKEPFICFFLMGAKKLFLCIFIFIKMSLDFSVTVDMQYCVSFRCATQ